MMTNCRQALKIGNLFDLIFKNFNQKLKVSHHIVVIFEIITFMRYRKYL